MQRLDVINYLNAFNKNRSARLNRQLQDDDDVRKEFTKDSINAIFLLNGKQFFKVHLYGCLANYLRLLNTPKTVKSVRLTDCPDA